MEPHREGNKDISSGTVVGIIAGFGELISYGFRLLSGYIGYRTKCFRVLPLKWDAAGDLDCMR